MKHLPLPQNWTVTAVGDTSQVPADIAGQAIPATVPGCVHTDLLAAGLIPDPYLDENEQRVQWIGRVDWCFAGTFELSAEDLSSPRIDLACDGLDTLATVQLNGEVVGQAQNMHTRHRFDAKAALRLGTNELKITFAAALPHAEAEMKRLGDLPKQGGGSNPQHPHNFMRKMACNFGWDWGPVLTTAGIWRDLRIEAWESARLADVRPIVERADTAQARVTVHADVESQADTSATIVTTLTAPDGQTFEAQGPAQSPLPINIDRPDLWWPVGHGEQPLYDLKVSVQNAQGQTIDQARQRIGLRTVELDTTADDPEALPGLTQGTLPGSAMTLKVNGKPIFCKGANWIPDDCFPSRITPERLRHRIDQALGANMNMLRVWGGGTYESDTFYETCDERGVMVWQDFLFACAAYSEEEPLASLIEAEVHDNVARLVRHPSLVLWNGGNECIWGYEAWNYQGKPWPQTIGDRGWGARYFHDVLPQALDQLAPGSAYWPNSPYSGTPDREPNANQFGNRHIWDVWFGPGHYNNYLGHFPRFASEFGFHGPSTWSTIERSVPADQWHWDSACMNAHNKNSSDSPGQAQTHERMADDFEPPSHFDDWLYLAQVGQARALDMGIRWFRALAPYCSGTLFWQFNDCWPVSSWSAIDGDGKPKPMYHAARRFFAPRLLTIKPRQVVGPDGEIGKLALYAHNDSDLPWRGVVRLQLLDLQGNTQSAQGVTIDVAARGSQRFDVPDGWHDDSDQRFIAAEFLGNDSEADDTLIATPAFWWFSPDKEYDYAEVDFDAMLEHDASAATYYLTLKSNSVIRDLCVFADRLDADAVVSDQCVTLLPGQVFEFAIQSTAALKLEDLTAPPVLQAVNRFGRQAMLV